MPRALFFLKEVIGPFAREAKRVTSEGVPHTVIGLHYESRDQDGGTYLVAELVLVVVKPIYAPTDKPFAMVSTDDIARVFVAACTRIRYAPVQLGCIGPPRAGNSPDPPDRQSGR